MKIHMETYEKEKLEKAILNFPYHLLFGKNNEELKIFLFYSLFYIYGAYSEIISGENFKELDGFEVKVLKKLAQVKRRNFDLQGNNELKKFVNKLAYVISLILARKNKSIDESKFDNWEREMIKEELGKIIDDTNFLIGFKEL